METKRELTTELSSVVKTALKEERGDGNEVLSSNVVTAVCNVTEAIFIHGLKDPYFLKGSRHAKYPEPNFWPFISKFASRNVRSQISNLSQIKSDVGKARAWLRLSLNETVMENYVAAFSREMHTVRLFYHRNSYLRDSEQIEIMMNYMKALSRLNFKIPVNSSILNSWTPTPLKLAGLLKESKRPAFLPQMESLEDDVPLAVSALEFEGLEDSSGGDRSSLASTSAGVGPEDTAPPSPHAILIRKKIRKQNRLFSDEETSSSIYSHPSLMDAKFSEIMRSMEAEKKSIGSSGGTPGPTLEGELIDSGFEDPEGGSSNSKREEVFVHRSTNRGQGGSPSLKCIPTPTPPPKTTAEAGIQTEEEWKESLTKVLDALNETDDENLMPESQSVQSVEEESFLTAEETSPDEESTTNFSQETENERNVGTDRRSSQPMEMDSPKKMATFAEREAKSLSLADYGFSELEDRRAISPIGNNLAGRMGCSWSSADLSHVTIGSDVSSSAYDGRKQSDRSQRADSRNTSENESSIGAEEEGGNFSSVLRSALICQQVAETEAEEFSAANNNGRTELRGGAFAETMNEEVEIGRSTLANDEDDETGRVSREISWTAGSRAESSEDFVVIEKSACQMEMNTAQHKYKLLTAVGQEVGLDCQNFMCQSCRRYIGLAYGPFRVCAFDGCYYCVDCHRNDQALVPARLVLNWDFQSRKVSRASKAFLDHVADRPLIHLDQVNPTLYEAVDIMEKTLRLREQLSYVAMYLMTCKESVAEDLRKRLWPKEYLYTDVHLYSVNDFINVSSGVLQKHLNSVIAFARNHVKDCRLCSQKGFICEICNHPQIIYPFQVEITHRCDKCYAVFHLECRKGRPCPRCQRREAYIKDRKASNMTEEEMLNQIAIEDG